MRRSTSSGSCRCGLCVANEQYLQWQRHVRDSESVTLRENVTLRMRHGTIPGCATRPCCSRSSPLWATWAPASSAPARARRGGGRDVPWTDLLRADAPELLPEGLGAAPVLDVLHAALAHLAQGQLAGDARVVDQLQRPV